MSLYKETINFAKLEPPGGFLSAEFRSIIDAYRFVMEVPMPANLGFLGLSRLAKPLTGEEGLKILDRDHYRCQYCGLDGMTSFENSLIMTVDFVLPRARKGKKDPKNLVAACRPCNRIKGSRVFANLDDAKTYVLQRRSELRKEWGTNMARLRGRSASA